MKPIVAFFFRGSSILKKLNMVRENLTVNKLSYYVPIVGKVFLNIEVI